MPLIPVLRWGIGLGGLALGTALGAASNPYYNPYYRSPYGTVCSRVDQYPIAAVFVIKDHRNYLPAQLRLILGIPA